MENTTENKARFFSLYFNQKVYNHDKYGTDGPVVNDTLHINWLVLGGRDDGYFLSLRSISSLTDEEIDVISYIIQPDRINRHNPKPIRAKDYTVFNFQGYEVITIYNKGTIKYSDLNGVDVYTLKTLAVYDYLRSISILIPWMDLSVEQIIGYGWAKEDTSC